MVGAPEYCSHPDKDLLGPILQDSAGYLGPNFDSVKAWSDQPERVSTASKEQRSQQCWSEAIVKGLLDGRIASVSLRDQNRLLEQRSGLGTTWMTALPNSTFSSEDYCVGVRWLLGVPLLAQSTPCPGCGLPVDVTGDHFLCCKRIDFSARHNAVQDALFSVLAANGQTFSKEFPLQHIPDSQCRPADLLLVNWQG